MFSFVQESPESPTGARVAPASLLIKLLFPEPDVPTSKTFRTQTDFLAKVPLIFTSETYFYIPHPAASYLYYI